MLNIWKVFSSPSCLGDVIKIRAPPPSALSSDTSHQSCEKFRENVTSIIQVPRDTWHCQCDTAHLEVQSSSMWKLILHQIEWNLARKWEFLHWLTVLEVVDICSEIYFVIVLFLLLVTAGVRRPVLVAKLVANISPTLARHSQPRPVTTLDTGHNNTN